MPRTITRAWLFVMQDDDGNEGLMFSHPGGHLLVPLVVCERDAVDSVVPAAQELAEAAQRPYRIFELSLVGDVTGEFGGVGESESNRESGPPAAEQGKRLPGAAVESRDGAACLRIELPEAEQEKLERAHLEVWFTPATARTVARGLDDAADCADVGIHWQQAFIAPRPKH